MEGTQLSADVNAEAIEAWDGPLFDRFVAFRHLVVGGLAPHGDEALRVAGPRAGEHVNDIGCGFGDTTRQLGELVGAEGRALGVDAAPRFIELATAEAEEAGAQNVRFLTADVQTVQLDQQFDMAFSRFGTMFFANPVVALRNIGSTLVPGGRLTMVVWRRREDNDWVYRAQQIVEGILSRPEEYDEPTCGPGPFSMAGADTASDVLLGAGFQDIALRRCELPILIGNGVDEAIELITALGPAGEIIRLWGDRAAHRHDEIRQALLDGMGDMVDADGTVHAGASTWIVTAVKPGA
jgi:SAM-dependent methyltransferase